MDPPYNVKVEPRSNNAIAAGLSSFTSTHHQGLDLARRPGAAKPTHDELRPKDRPLANDFIPDDEFALKLRAWFGNAARVLLPGRSFYIWGGYANCANYPSALSESGLYFSQSVIWVKEHPVLTRKDFMGNHEWCFYGWKEGAAHEFFGPRCRRARPGWRPATTSLSRAISPRDRSFAPWTRRSNTPKSASSRSTCMTTSPSVEPHSCRPRSQSCVPIT
jgi:hypothetical protein